MQTKSHFTQISLPPLRAALELEPVKEIRIRVTFFLSMLEGNERGLEASKFQGELEMK